MHFHSLSKDFSVVVKRSTLNMDPVETAGGSSFLNTNAQALLVFCTVFLAGYSVWSKKKQVKIIGIYNIIALAEECST